MGCEEFSPENSNYSKVSFNGFRMSMVRRGKPYDNAVAESFVKTLKTEEVYLWEYETLGDVGKTSFLFH
jgi:putative transposase